MIVSHNIDIGSPTIYVPPTKKILSYRKLEGMKKLAEIRKWGLRNPTKFMNRFIGAELLDSQEYVFNMTWDKMYSLWLCSRNYGKTTLIALYFMTRGMLLSNARFYIAAGSAEQSIEAFEKIRSIANREIESFTGLSEVFNAEVIKNSLSDGFVKNPAGFYFKLYNNFMVKTLNSAVNTKRGKRAEGVCFDESGWLPEETFQTIEPFTAQNKGFKLGGNVDVSLLPRELPNQLLYTSSASSVDSCFFNKYRDYSKQMILGSRNHFVADLNCDIVLNATYKGKVYPVSLLSKEKIENALRENREKGLREYYNIFTSDAGEDAIIKRYQVIRNSYTRPPELFSAGTDCTYGLFYDPARSADNSVILVARYIYDEKVGWKMRLVNLVNFMDINKKKKTPLRTPEQILLVKELLLKYNGNVPDYENIEVLGIDAGSGGGGVNISDFLMADWYEQGFEGDISKKHRGLIDKEHSSDYIGTFPNAIDKLRLLEPVKYKSIMYEALIEMISQDLVEFTAEYDNKGFLTIFEEDVLSTDNSSLSDLSNEDDEDEEPIADFRFKTQIYKLTPEEEIALAQLDALKEELYNMVRKKRESKDSFELSPLKQNTLHDDRAYTAAMAGYYLQQLRRKDFIKKSGKTKNNTFTKLPIRIYKRSSILN